MRWEDERYVRLYVRDTAEWLALGWEAQALLMQLLRKADRAGIVHTGKAGVRGLAALAGMPLDVVSRVLPALLDDGCLRAMEGGWVFPNFLAAQEAKSSDAQRKREQRARDRDKAVAGGAVGSRSGLDAEAAMSRADGQEAGQPSRPMVTRGGHAAPDNVTGVTDLVTPSCAVPSRTVPSLSASQGAALASPASEDVSDRPALVLVEQKPGRAPRKPSAGEALYARLEEVRAEFCQEAGVSCVPSRWPYGRQNRDLGPITRLAPGSAEQEAFQAAWDAFLEDPKAKELDVPYSLDWFWRFRSRYEGQGLKASEGVAP